jgi:hypothetical protein
MTLPVTHWSLGSGSQDVTPSEFLPLAEGRHAPAGAGAYHVSLGKIQPGDGGVLDAQTSSTLNASLPVHTFRYDVTTVGPGGAGCGCVPPLAPQYLTLASMTRTTCSSVSLYVYAPWATTDPGGEDEVQVVQSGHATATTRESSASQMSHMVVSLYGGPWRLTVSELKPAVTGDQASVFVRGVLSCATADGR